MDNPSTSTITPLFDHPLPHQQFSSRLAFANTSIAKPNRERLNSFPNKKSTRLPPIAAKNDCSPKSAESSSDSISSFEDNNAEVCNEIESIKIRQLKRNVLFVKEHCHDMLTGLHNELDQLKRKNRGKDRNSHAQQLKVSSQ